MCGLNDKLTHWMCELHIEILLSKLQEHEIKFRRVRFDATEIVGLDVIWLISTKYMRDLLSSIV